MAQTLRRATTFLSRSLRAGRYGFLFTGTRHTKLPRRLFLAGKLLDLSYPDDTSLLSDLNNIILDDEYGLRSVFGPIETIVDIGANIGLFSIWARHCFPSARIFAYEPNPGILAFTRSNLENLDITLHAEGVASRSGRARMTSASSTRVQKAERSTCGEIPLVGLDCVVQRAGGKVDLLKIDCEGGEWDILHCSGALQHVRLIRMEYHLETGPTLQRWLDDLPRLGFEVTRIEPNRGFGIVWLKRLA